MLMFALATNLGSPERENAIWLQDAMFFRSQTPTDLQWLTGVVSVWDSIRIGELWRLISPIFLHFGPMHLAFNGLYLYRYGTLIEQKKGHWKMLAIILLAAVIGNVAEGMWQGFRGDPLASFGGMSGVTFGLGGYLWMKGKVAPYEKLGLSSYDVGFMLAWLVLCMVTTLVGAMAIANAAHLMGMAAGMACALWKPAMRKLRRGDAVS
jgi:GlpG protein